MSAFPPDGQTGVTSDVQMIITFSAAMNPNSVKLAYASSTLLAGQVTFTWDSTGTVLTITPNLPLSYATGSSPSIVANSYSYQISAAATSQAGVPLAAPLSVTFSTLKRISASTAATGVYTILTDPPSGTPSATACSGSAQPGQNVALAFVADLVMYVTFSIPQPPQGLYAVESATMTGPQMGPTGDPYGTSPLTADQITYESPPTFADDSATPIRSLGVFASSNTALPMISVLPTMQEAFTATGHGVLLRFQFGAFPSTTAYANFSCTGWTISFTYLTA